MLGRHPCKMPSSSIRIGLFAVLLLTGTGAALAQEVVAGPVIREIAFAGNKTTRPSVMLREMVVHVGDPVDPALVERSRQGIQDLGLFRSVGVTQEPVEGGVRLVFTVKERFYILPLPSASANSDGDYSYGFRAQWFNAWGLNHRGVAYYKRSKPSEGAADPVKRGEQTRYQLRYSAPFIADSPFGLNLELGRHITPYTEPLVYELVADFASVGVSRKLSKRAGSQGWELSAGLTWNRQNTSGPDAPPDQGRQTGLAAGVSFRDLRDNLYSDVGVTHSLSVETASRDVLSDYASTRWNAAYANYAYVGETPHQSLNFFASATSRHGDPPGSEPALSLGGVDNLRGFEPETVKGNAYYLLSAEFLRPVFRDSIRALAVVDVGSMVDSGNVVDQPGDENIGKVLVSAGLGVRIRVQAFVNLELEVGVAWPLNGGGYRIFASKL